MIKAYKYPIKLTDTNKSILMNWSNRCRYIWNQSLDLRKRLYKKYKISISYNGKYFPNGQFKIFLKYKCKNNNVELIEVDPKYTSLKCNKCGNIDKKNRVSQSSFICTKCGHAENADLHASKNILDAGIKTLADSPE